MRQRSCHAAAYDRNLAYHSLPAGSCNRRVRSELKREGLCRIGTNSSYTRIGRYRTRVYILPVARGKARGSCALRTYNLIDTQGVAVVDIERIAISFQTHGQELCLYPVCGAVGWKKCDVGIGTVVILVGRTAAVVKVDGACSRRRDGKCTGRSVQGHVNTGLRLQHAAG